jgi:hypothetical protein
MRPAAAGAPPLVPVCIRNWDQCDGPIYMAAPPLPCFFMDGGVGVCASFIFYSYALEVFVEICVRAMPLKFVPEPCLSHARPKCNPSRNMSSCRIPILYYVSDPSRSLRPDYLYIGARRGR